jgi:hypothetical protein
MIMKLKKKKRPGPTGAVEPVKRKLWKKLIEGLTPDTITISRNALLTVSCNFIQPVNAFSGHDLCELTFLSMMLVLRLTDRNIFPHFFRTIIGRHARQP